MDEHLRHEVDEPTPAPRAPESNLLSAPSETERQRRLALQQRAPEASATPAPAPAPALAEQPKAEVETEVQVESESRKERRAREKAEREAAKLQAKEDKEREQAERVAAKEAEKAAKDAAKRMSADEKQAAKEAEKAAKEAAKRMSAEEKQAAKDAAEAAKEADKEAAKAEKEAAKLAKAEERAAKKAGRKKPKGDDKNAREKKLVGLKIGASQIAAARVHNNGSPELVEAVREPLEPGLVVSGEIRDTAALAGALERFFARHKLPKKGVRLGLSNNRIGVRVFEIEGVEDERQLENAIRFRAEEVLPIPLDEAVLDYVVLGDETREDGTSVRRILLVVAYREVVDRYLEACQGAGIEVVGIDLEAFALLRSLHAPTEEPPGGGALVAVAVGHDRTTIAVSTGQYCEFTRVLDWGGFALNVAIARALDRAPSEVESIKRHVSFSEVVPVDGLDDAESQKVYEAAQRALQAFARELVSSLHFYQAQPGALGIGEIVITGGAAHMSGFAEAVGRLIGAPVRLGDPFARVKLGKSVDQDDQAGSFAVAIGLGIED